MKLIRPKEFGLKKWDEWVDQLPDENIYMQSNYLSATTDEWLVLVNDHHLPVMPVPVYEKLGVKRALQPQFNRAFYLPKEQIEEVVNFLQDNFKSFEFNFHTQHQTDKTYQVLNIDSYSPKENARRMVKKAIKQGYKIRTFSSYREVLKIFEETTLDKIDSLQSGDMKYVYELCKVLSEVDQLLVKGIFLEDELVGGGLYLKNKSRLTYLKGAAYKENKKNGAMFLMMDAVINEIKGEFTIFDFGGSSVPGVAGFYKKFGAEDRYCIKIEKDNLPAWFKWLQRVKRKVTK